MAMYQDSSSVELVQHVGDDLTVVNSARVSFYKESELEDGMLSTRDNKLIRYLAKHNHWTPFSHCFITLRETVPIFVARQRFKHMVGFSYNEVSRRYVKDNPTFYRPNKWRGRPENAKQGSSDVEISELGFQGLAKRPIGMAYDKLIEHAYDLYQEMILEGVCPEQARMVLPQSMITSYYVSGSLAAWARAYNLRAAPDAQLEIQQLAHHWDRIIGPLYPVSWEVLTDV